MQGLDLNNLPWLAAVVLLVLNLLKEPLGRTLPKYFGSLVRRAEAETELAADTARREAEDDVAIMQAMIRLQTEAIRQNEKLLDFVMQRLDARINELASALREEMASVRQELYDIGQRWLANSQALGKVENEGRLYRHEIVALVDRMRSIEEKMDGLTIKPAAPVEGGTREK